MAKYKIQIIISILTFQFTQYMLQYTHEKFCCKY